MIEIRKNVIICLKKMLKNCLLPVVSKKNINTKCGEIICQNEENFTIICAFCEMKLFDFSDFLLHFKNLHFKGINKLKSATPKPNNFLKGSKITIPNAVDDDDKIYKTNVQTEQYEENTLISETSNDFIRDVNSYQASEFINVGDDESYGNSSNNEEEEAGIEVEVEVEEEEEAEEAEEEIEEDEDEDEDEDEEYWQEDSIDEHEDQNSKVLNIQIMKNHKCEICDKCYRTAHGLKSHLKQKHMQPKDFKCSECNKEFFAERFLQTHIRKTHTAYSCTQCDRVYKSPYTLKNHVMTHSKTKDFICDYENCGKAFVTKRRLAVHKEMHTNITNYVCEVCGYRTRIKTALVVHRRKHTGEKPFKCRECGKCFASSSLLIEHKASHSTDKPFKCDVCGASFTRAKTLYHHKPLHLDIKKFICKICGKAYAQASGLCGHMRQHKMPNLPDRISSLAIKLK